MISMNEDETYMKLYSHMLKLSNEYGCNIEPAEFAIMGVQSSGKTCPVRFEMSNQRTESLTIKKLDEELIEVKKHFHVRIFFPHFVYFQHKIMYELCKKDTKKKRADILTVKIGGPEVPQLVIVDLPGIVRSDDEKHKDEKEELDKITEAFLHERQSNDSKKFKYTPIVVRETTDEANEVDISRIDKLASKRPKWKDEGIFVVTKFDIRCDRPADGLVSLIKNKIQYNKKTTTIVVINKDSSYNTMNDMQKLAFIRKGPEQERTWWEQKMDMTKSHKHHDEFVSLVNDYCYISRMKQVIVDKAKVIVKEYVPVIRKTMDERWQGMNQTLGCIVRSLNQSKVSKLRDFRNSFNERFKRNIKELYNGKSFPHAEETHKLSLSDEMEMFHRESRLSKHKSDDKYTLNSSFLDAKTRFAIDFEKNGYYIEPNELYRQLNSSSSGRFSLFLTNFNEKLAGTAASVRAFKFWRTLIALIPMPNATYNQILNAASHYYGGTMDPNPWTTVRNVLMGRCDILKGASAWLACYLEWMLIRDGRFVYEWTMAEMLRELGQIDSQSINMANLFRFTIDNYVAFVKYLVDEFEEKCRGIPEELASIIDEESVNQHLGLATILGKACTKIKNVGANSEPQQQQQGQQNAQSNGVNSQVVDGSLDIEYFSTVFGETDVIQPTRHPLFIREICITIWNEMKFNSTKVIQDREKSRIWRHILQDNSCELATALQKGVVRPRVDELLKQLAQKCAISIDELNEFIKKNGTDTSIDLKDEELARICGVDQKKLKDDFDTHKTKMKSFKNSQDEVHKLLANLESDRLQKEKSLIKIKIYFIEMAVSIFLFENGVAQ
ncbi:hypothetical protein RFI_02701, partial [Reticulomyxa filosa]